MPRHGGKDPGTVSQNIFEKDINLKISLYLEEELSKVGAGVILIREGDYDLSKPNAIWRKKSDFDNRIKKINESKADLYLSIHQNYSENSNYKGVQIFSNEKNEKFAKFIQDYINLHNQGKRKNKALPKNIYMYNKLTVPGVLIECGFLSNFQERKNLLNTNYQRKIASLIVQGIIEYY